MPKALAEEAEGWSPRGWAQGRAALCEVGDSFRNTRFASPRTKTHHSSEFQAMSRSALMRATTGQPSSKSFSSSSRRPTWGNGRTREPRSRKQSCSGEGEGRKDKGGGGGSRSKTKLCVTKLYVKDGVWQGKMVCVCDKVVCKRWCVTRKDGVCVWQSCVKDGVCVCVWKLCVKESVWQSCVWKMVCDKVVCERRCG